MRAAADVQWIPNAYYLPLVAFVLMAGALGGGLGAHAEGRPGRLGAAFGAEVIGDE